MNEHEESYESYEESLEFVKGTPDNLYPDFIFKPAFNDFEDDYYELSFADTKLQSDAKKIRRKYNDYFQWEKAMGVYTEYMNSLIEVWGSIKIIENSVEQGTFPDFVPSKPKLRNTKRNKRYLRDGVVPTERHIEFQLSDEEMIAIARQLFPNRMGEEIYEDDYKMTKSEKLVYERHEQQSERRDRRANLYRDIGNSRGTDFIVEYLAQAKHGVYNSSGYKKKNASNDERGLVDKAKELIRIAETPQWILDEELNPHTQMSNGRIVDRKEMEQSEILKILYEQGFNVIQSISGRADKRAVKMIRRQIGATEPMTKKEMKKLQKRNKKDQMRIQRRRDEAGVLSQVLLKNKLEKNRDAHGNLTLRMHDLFPND